MKSALPTLAAVCLAFHLAAAPPAAAQTRRPVTVGIALGGTVPVSDFADNVKTGGHLMALVQYEPARAPWGIRGEFGYHRAAYTDDFLVDVGATPDAGLRNAVSHLGASAIVFGPRGDGMTPYLLGGVGAYRLTVSRSSGSSSLSESEDGLGFNGGAGIRFGRDAGVFIEARFHQFSITPDARPFEPAVRSTYRMIPLTVGVRF